MGLRKFHLRIYDNFHYMDESEAYDHGQYGTYYEALIAAKAIVDEWLKQNYKPGIKPEDLSAKYAMYGEDPVIIPNEAGENELFSGRKYANEIADEICRKLGQRP